ncbi:mercuric reductase [mine drainage metagenome]|uniref:Mercuric reductase n=1 Tax=mine drainage metagenome TaxID=410659 RepID=A0A1J5PSV8_9ZZZZ
MLVLRGRPIGVGIVGTQAGEMIGLWALAIANHLRMTAIAATILPYPTYGEISKRAAGAYFSPKLFDSSMVKRIVRWVQRILP